MFCKKLHSLYLRGINHKLFIMKKNLFILIIAMLYHAKLGNETIVEDYVTSHNLKKTTKSIISALTYLFMISTTISLLYIISS